MKTTTLYFLFALLAFTGCSSAQIAGRRMTQTPAGPYRKVLVCSMDTEIYRRVLEESRVKRELERRPMQAKTCSEFFRELSSDSDAEVQSHFQQAGFDAILAWHRRPILQIEEGTGPAKLDPLSLEGLLQTYRHRVLEQSGDAMLSDGQARMEVQEGRQTVEQGEVYFVDARSGRPVWQGRGAVLAPTDAPVEHAADALAKKAVQAFIKDDLIPRS